MASSLSLSAEKPERCNLKKSESPQLPSQRAVHLEKLECIFPAELLIAIHCLMHVASIECCSGGDSVCSSRNSLLIASVRIEALHLLPSLSHIVFYEEGELQ